MSWTRHAIKARVKEMEAKEGRGKDRGGGKGKNREERCTWVSVEEQATRTCQEKDENEEGEEQHEQRSEGSDEEKHHEEDSEAEDEERFRMAPNMGAGGSHPQAMTDPEEKQQRQEGQWVLRPAREWWSEPSPIMKWADCVEEEPEDEREERMQNVEDVCEEKEAEEQRRGVEQAESGGEKEQETEEEDDEREEEVNGEKDGARRGKTD